MKRILVDYDIPLISAIAVGNYPFANDAITEKRFPKKRTGKKQVDMIPIFVKDARTPEIVVHKLGNSGWRPADIWELIAFGSDADPKEFAGIPIVALDHWEVVNEFSYIPYVVTSGGLRGRELSLIGRFLFMRYSLALFLAIPKNTPSFG